MPSDTRDRLIDVGAALLCRQGYVGTGVKQIVTEASAPFGSLYHFFPGGKEQLGAEAVRRSGAIYGELVPLIFDSAPDIIRATRSFFEGAAEALSENDWADACPIATVALEVSGTNEPLRQACADVFEAWLELVGARFRAAGIAPSRARELAISVVALLEGAFVLARALRSTEPVLAAGRSAVAEVERALTQEVTR
ncbi:TetR/AcrR family transcriptional regulator [Iamia sp.]|uniref:TetR/AcrR family transcriptional regulator n=1 Tax=Iamia sp. TaxID=2722710 RepID=UPI002BBD95FB|nr:TetR/AcrR family transcriptional regulator [Iamia sp.]HXH56975.1 TetR/AcrR family transcriptional regulator [Iamia sp.]